MSVAVRSREFQLSTGQLELLKWVAVAAMVVDHLNAAIYGREAGVLADAVGRIAFPLFAGVLAYNLARPGVDYARVIERLCIFGLLAEPFHMALFGVVGPWPLNVMFTFAVAAGVVWAMDRGDSFTAAVLFFGAALFCEYWQPGVALVVASVAVFRWGWERWWPALLFAVLALCWVNGNVWALLAFPVVMLVGRSPVGLLRSRWAFYAFYPVHLAALAWLAFGV